MKGTLSPLKVNINAAAGHKPQDIYISLYIFQDNISFMFYAALSYFSPTFILQNTSDVA